MPVDFPPLVHSLGMADGGLEFLISIVGFQRCKIQKFGTRDRMVCDLQRRTGLTDDNICVPACPGLREGSVYFLPAAPTVFSLSGLSTLSTNLQQVLERRSEASAAEPQLDIHQLGTLMADAVALVSVSRCI